MSGRTFCGGADAVSPRGGEIAAGPLPVTPGVVPVEAGGGASPTVAVGGAAGGVLDSTASTGAGGDSAAADGGVSVNANTREGSSASGSTYPWSLAVSRTLNCR